MQEASNPFGFGGDAGDPANLAAVEQAREIQGKQVIDVNGLPLGRVSRSFAEEGALIRFDVTLSPQAKQVFDVDRDVAGVPAVAIAEVDEERVRLSEAGEQILHPEDPSPLHARGDERGAKELPRKVR